MSHDQRLQVTIFSTASSLCSLQYVLEPCYLAKLLLLSSILKMLRKNRMFDSTFTFILSKVYNCC